MTPLEILEKRHPKPWKFFLTCRGVGKIVDANCPEEIYTDSSVVIGRVRYRTEDDILLAGYILSQLNQD